nr:hypothetical protein CFP56_24337 [Quercus suber]
MTLTSLPETIQQRVEPRGEGRSNVTELAEFVRKINTLAPGPPPRTEVQREGRIARPGSESPLMALPPSSGQSEPGGSWFRRRRVKHSTSAHSLNTSPEIGRARGQSLHSLSEYHEQIEERVAMTSPHAPPPLPAAFAHLAHHVPTPISSPVSTESPVLSAPSLSLRQQSSTQSLRSIFGMRPKSPAVVADSKGHGTDNTLLRSLRRVRQEALEENESETNRETKPRRKLTKDPDSPASRESERKTKIKLGRKFIARTSTLGWVTKKPLTELTDEEVAAVGVVVMDDKEPTNDKGSKGLRNFFRFVGVDQAKLEHVKTLRAHEARCREEALAASTHKGTSTVTASVASDTKLKDFSSDASNEAPLDEHTALDPSRDIKVTTTIED